MLAKDFYIDRIRKNAPLPGQLYVWLLGQLFWSTPNFLRSFMVKQKITGRAEELKPVFVWATV